MHFSYIYYFIKKKKKSLLFSGILLLLSVMDLASNKNKCTQRSGGICGGVPGVLQYVQLCPDEKEEQH